MSTADSAVLQFSNMVMCDWVIYGPFQKAREHFQKKEASLVWAKIPSLLVFALSVIWAGILDDDPYAYGTLMGIQFGLGFGSVVWYVQKILQLARLPPIAL